MDLQNKAIKLNQVVTTKEEAIKLAGQTLVDAGFVQPEYINSMLKREDVLSTYMGNFIAIPHGVDGSQDQIIESGISIIQLNQSVNFGEPGSDKDVLIVFGIAGKGNEHLDLLSEIAVFCSEIENVQKLAEAATVEDVKALLGGN